MKLKKVSSWFGNWAALLACKHHPRIILWADLFISAQNEPKFCPSCLPVRRYCQSQPWIWSCSVAVSLLMFSVWYLDPIPISKAGPPGALTFWSAWRLSRPPACGISCQSEQTTPQLQNIHPLPPHPALAASLPFTVTITPPPVLLPWSCQEPQWS